MGLNFGAYVGQLAASGRPDLHIEMSEAVLHLPSGSKGRTKLAAHGVGAECIRAAGGLGALRIVTEEGHFFPAGRDDSRAVGALILPVFDNGLVDLIAFSLDDPTQFSVRVGYARALGMSNADGVREKTTLWPMPDGSAWSGEPHPSLPLFPQPLAWLQAGCRGTVVLNLAWLSHTLVGIRAVVAHNERHAAALYRLLTWPGAPKIYLRRQQSEAA